MPSIVLAKRFRLILQTEVRQSVYQVITASHKIPTKNHSTATWQQSVDSLEEILM